MSELGSKTNKADMKNTKDMIDTKDTRAIRQNKLVETLTRTGVYFIILVLFIAGILISPKFFTVNNLKNVLIACGSLGILCAGMGFVTYAGKMVDMSVPIIIAVSGIVTIDTLVFGIPQALICGLVAAALIGLINGIVVGKFKTNPMIWTLAMNFLIDGLIRWIYSNSQIYADVAAVDFPDRAEFFIQISRTELLSIPLSVWVMVMFFIISQFMMSKTSFGKQLKVIGSSPDVAKYCGIPITKNIIVAYVLSAICAGVAGIFITSMGKVGAYYNGQGYDFQAATALVLGGMSLAGGKGNMIGVLGGVITIMLMRNLLTIVGIGTFVQNIVTGAVFVLIVFINSQSLRKLGWDIG
jgi:ribose transport system permease protein